MTGLGSVQPIITVGITELRGLSSVAWEIERVGAMRVPGRVFASRPLLEQENVDKALRQVQSVAHLPGIVEASFAMPDMHPGYGFPIGGVAATDVAADGVVSPGGVGFDIGCGVRLLSSEFTLDQFDEYGRRLMDRLARVIPRGSGPGGIVSGDFLPSMLRGGAQAAVDAGFGRARDIERIANRGWFEGASPDLISGRARDRGRRQVGSLGGGNHFLELQVVEQVVDRSVATAFGIIEGGICVMIHCGSRGLGHQVCTDSVATAQEAMPRYAIVVPDRQLACVPVESPEGAAYLSAMWAASNFALANRQVLTHEVRRTFADVFETSVDDVPVDIVYDVLHNMASLEVHPESLRNLCVHRKGATPAHGAGHADLPADLRDVGQPVLLPGSMGTSSWVLVGTNGNPAFSSAPHGAGRVMSRTAARRIRAGSQVQEEMTRAGIIVRPKSVKELAEEAAYAYKDVSEVVSVSDLANLAKPVAELRPLGVVKG